MTPFVVVLLLYATLYMEESIVGITIALARQDFGIVWLLLFKSVLSYFLNLPNFLVTKHTSALTLQVSQIFYFVGGYFIHLLYSLVVPYHDYMGVQVELDYTFVTLL